MHGGTEGEEGLHLVAEGEDLGVVGEDAPWLRHVLLGVEPAVDADRHAESTVLGGWFRV